MSLLLNCQSLAKSFGADPLFEELSFTVSEADRLGLIGPNGSGKSTLLEILAGLQEPGAGEATVRKGVTLGYVAQDSVFPSGVTIHGVLDAALDGLHLDESERQAKLATTLGLAGITDRDQEAAALSGGWRKRLALAEALVRSPDILLLDEPTNHLDLQGIAWLERLLKSVPFAVVLVSHDRYFLENVATSVAELNRAFPGGLFRVEGNYSRFLEKRAEFLAAQAKLQESLATKVRREVEWLRRGAKARTTKAKARITEAGRLMEQLDEVTARRQTGAAQVDFTGSERRTKKLIETRDLACAAGGRTLFEGLNLRLSPGMRLGLVGANGSGKSTLLKVLTGEMEPVAGTLEHAENLQVVYFDQNREQLDLAVSLRRALAPDGDSVIYRGRPVHVAGWAKRFLFRNEQLDVAVGRLSGGERARVLLARLMLRPADVLMLDEPTNDLDIETLEVLEESLLEFPGALVLVTHDRYLLDRVATTVLGLDGEGQAELFADYAQWEQWIDERQSAKSRKEERPAAPPRAQPTQKKRLSYLESREWESIEERILEAEELLARKHDEMNAAASAADAGRLRTAYEEVQTAQAEVNTLYDRWAELEAKVAASTQ